MRRLAGLGVAVIAAVGVTIGTAAGWAAGDELDYEMFKTRVEPIFLKKRVGHTRCYVCHAETINNAFRLERLPAGAAFWTEEQSRHNFDTVSGLVAPGDPASSKLLLHPLAPEAGGEAYHSGGRQFETKTDPDWRTIAQWVNGQKAPGKN